MTQDFARKSKELWLFSGPVTERLCRLYVFVVSICSAESSLGPLSGRVLHHVDALAELPRQRNSRCSGDGPSQSSTGLPNNDVGFLLLEDRREVAAAGCDLQELVPSRSGIEEAAQGVEFS
ncbi:MAG: hypothetical protein O2931_01335 [Planctomycetota bacterium]|nr:hypothetical protein [Planctomycetota bacterium]MDA1177416.1 hypothetical protein [Planctomycetota bacterium]